MAWLTCWCWETTGKEVCFLMPSMASPACRNPEIENSSVPSSLAVLKDMNAGAAPFLAGNCHCAAARLSVAVAPKSLRNCKSDARHQRRHVHMTQWTKEYEINLLYIYKSQ